MRAFRVFGTIGLALLLLAASVGACDTGAPVGASGARVGARVSAAGPRLRVLVLSQTRGYRHASIPWALGALRRLASGTPRYDLRLLATARELTPDALAHAAAVVFMLTSGELPLASSEKRALVAFVQQGGGLVGFHSATDTFHRWPGFIHLLGAEFSRHPLPSRQRIVVEDLRNPATRSLRRTFLINEEFYIFKRDPRSSAHVLARLDTGPRGPDRPLVWCRHVGRGRVFYDALGHFTQTWNDPRQLALLSGGLAWALGLARAPGC